MRKILITGALGQIGSELTLALRERYGNKNVIASDIKMATDDSILESVPFSLIDVTDVKKLAEDIKKHKGITVYN